MRDVLRATLLKVGLSVGLTLLLLEAGAAAVIYSGTIPSRVPSFDIPEGKQAFFVDIDPKFGAWHPPNKTHGHRRACFETSYRSNSYGALDVERERQSDRPRVVVLGDSFATGHGVVEQDRFSNQLQQLTSIPHMNFAAGGTGPTQYLMVYEHLARQFSHDRVLVSVLPANDFFDDEPTTVRYRPYWDGEYPNYDLRYTLDRPSDSKHHPSQFDAAVTAHDVLGSFSYFYNAADWVAGARKLMKSQGRKQDYAGYFDYTDAQLQRLRYSLEQLHAASPDGRLSVMLIPRYLDLSRHKQEGGRNPLGDALTAVAAEVGFQFVDMLPPMAKQYAGREHELFLGCDGHWSPLGHRVAAETLQQRLYAEVH